jgi:hypothetical protein
MRRIGERQVELSDTEVLIVNERDHLMDLGVPFGKAAATALNRSRVQYGMPDPAFVSFVSEGTVRRWGTRFIVRRPHPPVMEGEVLSVKDEIVKRRRKS